MHNLRNHNQSDAYGRICGTPYLGVFGSDIPTTGVDGPSPLYNDLTLPADAGKEFAFRILTWPASGLFYMLENGAFTFAPAADGTYYATAQLVGPSGDIGSPETFTMQSGAAGTVISATRGNATAAGLSAAVTNAGSTTIPCSVGNSIAAGVPVAISASNSVACSSGSAVAAGRGAAILFNRVLQCGIGNALALGLPAAVTNAPPSFHRSAARTYLVPPENRTLRIQ